MEEKKDANEILELVLQPAFLAADGAIVQVNRAAADLPLRPGMAIGDLLLTGQAEYEALTDGCLYLQLNLGGTAQGASVTRTAAGDLFLLADCGGSGELRAMALAARELRGPLTNVIAIAEGLLPGVLPQDERADELMARMSRGLYQLQRILGNMSDAGLEPMPARLETRNISQVFRDIFEKAAALAETAGVEIRYQGPSSPVMGLLDDQLLERAVLNMLSNAMKFLPQEGGVIQGELSCHGSFLRLSVRGNGDRIEGGVLGTAFSRYTRSPRLEDSRFGLGLGMVLIRRAAEVHGGTVLIDSPAEGGTRVTLTLKLTQDPQAKLHAPKPDLTGGRDPALIELSQVLPASVYGKER